MSHHGCFPPPLSAEETDACHIVRDANRQALAYVYFEGEPGRRTAAKLLTWAVVWVTLAYAPQFRTLGNDGAVFLRRPRPRGSARTKKRPRIGGLFHGHAGQNVRPVPVYP